MNKRIIIFLGIIFLLAIFLRFYLLEEKSVFYFDESYDALQARHIISEKKITLLGHPYSVSGTYQGPLYYYLSAPVLWLFNYNPLGIAVMIAIINLFAALALFLIAGKTFGIMAAFFSLIMFCISPLIVEQARKSWYPGPIEFLAPLIFYLLYFRGKSHKAGRLYLTGILTGLVMQFHILSFPIYIWGLFLSWKHQKIQGAILFTAGAVLGFLPIIIFELRHEFFNLRMFWEYFKKTSSFNLYAYLSRVVQFFPVLFNNVYINVFPFNLFGALIAFCGVCGIFVNKNKFGLSMIFFLISGSFIISFAAKEILFHYLAIFHFIPLFLFGLGISFLYVRVQNQSLKFILSFVLVAFFLMALLKTPFLKPSTWGMPQSRKAANIIAVDVKENHLKTFNLALIFHGETRAWPIRYFLDVLGVKPQEVEKYGNSKFQYVATNNIKLLNIDVWELKAGGSFRIERKWPLDKEFTLYKLNYINL